VYRLTDDLALVQTVDFFTPICGRSISSGLAAANSLSDVHAMGDGRSRRSRLSPGLKEPIRRLLGQILRGGLDKMTEASCFHHRRHSVNDPEIKVRLRGDGTVHPARIKANARSARGRCSGADKSDWDRGNRHGAQARIASAESVARPRNPCFGSIVQAVKRLLLRYDAAGLCTDLSPASPAGHGGGTGGRQRVYH